MERIKELLSKVKPQYVLLPIFAGILVWLVVSKAQTGASAVQEITNVDTSSSAGADTAVDDLGIAYQWAGNSAADQQYQDLLNTNPYTTDAPTGGTQTPTITPNVPAPITSNPGANTTPPPGVNTGPNSSGTPGAGYTTTQMTNYGSKTPPVGALNVPSYGGIY